MYVRPFIFQGHVGGEGGNKDLPENSVLDHIQVEIQFGGIVLQKGLL